MLAKISEIVAVHMDEAQWTPAPQYGGAVWEIDRSADGRRVIAAFQESGKSRFTYPFNEFMYVLRGSISHSPNQRPRAVQLDGPERTRTIRQDSSQMTS